MKYLWECSRACEKLIFLELKEMLAKWETVYFLEERDKNNCTEESACEPQAQLQLILWIQLGANKDFSGW